VVWAGSGLYVRSAYGPGNPWYRRATASGSGRIRAVDVERDVSFAQASAEIQGDIDAAYHAKYDRYGPRIVGSVTGPGAHQPMSAASCTMSRIRGSSLVCRRISSNAKLSKTSISSGSMPSREPISAQEQPQPRRPLTALGRLTRAGLARRAVGGIVGGRGLTGRVWAGGLGTWLGRWPLLAVSVSCLAC